MHVTISPEFTERCRAVAARRPQGGGRAELALSHQSAATDTIAGGGPLGERRGGRKTLARRPTEKRLEHSARRSGGGHEHGNPPGGSRFLGEAQVRRLVCGAHRFDPVADPARPFELNPGRRRGVERELALDFLARDAAGLDLGEIGRRELAVHGSGR
jgi:hypothetical protein